MSPPEATLESLYPVIRELPGDVRARLAAETQQMTVPTGTVLFDEHQP